jgi:hypothetical protein
MDAFGQILNGIRQSCEVDLDNPMPTEALARDC